MAPGLPFAAARDGMRLAVRLVPNAAADRIVGLAEGADGRMALKIAVRAAPHAGAANAALLRFLADALGVARRQVTLAQGASDRRKLVHVAGDPARLERLFQEIFEPWLKPA
jgi:uncharacterized protein (TIGR00251 family)